MICFLCNVTALDQGFILACTNMYVLALSFFFLGGSYHVTINSNFCIFQLAFYDQIKFMVMQTGYFKDNLPTHFTCSFLAVSSDFF